MRRTCGSHSPPCPERPATPTEDRPNRIGLCAFHLDLYLQAIATGRGVSEKEYRR